jgi:hypothetical protein
LLPARSLSHRMLEGAALARETFAEFTRQAIESAVRTAEEKSGRSLSRELRLQWLGKRGVIDSGIVEELVSRVFVAPDLIYPCVDLGVAGTDPEGRTLLVANVAGYAPGPFGKNWTGTDGPYVLIVGAPLLNGATLPRTWKGGGLAFTSPGSSGKKSGG